MRGPGKNNIVVDREYMESRSKLDQDTGCLMWQGSVNSDGYGGVRFRDKRRMGAHRVMWTVCIGEIPEGVHVLHKCDTPPCVNTEHLFLGSHQDNMADKKRKGRMVGMPGEENPNARFTNAQATEIYESPKAAPFFARKYRVTDAAIHGVRRGTTYGEVTKGLTLGKPLATDRLDPARARAIFVSSERATDLAKQIGVSMTTIGLIRDRRTWTAATEGLKRGT